MDSKPWFKNAVVYALDVETFKDADGDGVGDFRGLIQELDYLNRLGVSTLWLLPFYPSPNRDNGYDVVDYYGVDERFGSLGDFVEFVEAADDRGIRVIVDLVVNHTSDQHPWFQQARSAPDSKYRDFYVWVEEPPPTDPERGTVFPGEVEDERVWTYDSEAGAYYYHRFYPFQPDLDLTNPAVRKEIYKIMAFWLKLGVSGFRVDAATWMIQPKHPDTATMDDPHELLRGLKRHALSHRSDAVLLAEADDAPAELGKYVGEGDEMDLLMNFVLNAHLVAAIATERAAPVVEGLERLPPTGRGQWANFLRNYDELNIGRLPADLKETVFERFAADSGMRIYGRGIRRRLAPMLDGDWDQYRMAFSLLFSMPGVPMVLYGDEIGMGDDLSLPGRSSIRTAMQWSDDSNGGFSSASSEDLTVSVIDDGPFGYDRVNVERQLADPDSLFNFMTRLIATRRECRAIGHGTATIVPTDDSGTLVHRFDWEDTIVLCVHNLASDAATVEVPLELLPVESTSCIHGNPTLERADSTCRIELDGYGYGWFRIRSRTESSS